MDTKFTLPDSEEFGRFWIRYLKAIKLTLPNPSNSRLPTLLGISRRKYRNFDFLLLESNDITNIQIFSNFRNIHLNTKDFVQSKRTQIKDLIFFNETKTSSDSQGNLWF